MLLNHSRRRRLRQRAYSNLFMSIRTITPRRCQRNRHSPPIFTIFIPSSFFVVTAATNERSSCAWVVCVKVCVCNPLPFLLSIIKDDEGLIHTMHTHTKQGNKDNGTEISADIKAYLPASWRLHWVSSQSSGLHVLSHAERKFICVGEGESSVLCGLRNRFVK